MKKQKLLAVILTALLWVFAACTTDEAPLVAEEQPEQEEPMEEMPLPSTTFDITITNTVNYLNSIVFNTHSAATEPGPIPHIGCFYSVDFKAVPGTKLSFATMSVVTNDWFFSPSGEGIALFQDGSPVTGDVTDKVYLWDDGVEEEDPATRTSEPGGAEAGDPDDDNTVRIVEMDVTDFIKVVLSYDDATGNFNLKIENIAGSGNEPPIVISPGIVVLHAQNDPLFTEGEPDRGLGLAKIAVQGNPGDLHSWLTEVSDSGAPLRLSSSFTVLSPGIAYAFDGEADPVFTEGEAAPDGSGVEEIAEDGNNAVIFDLISGLGLPAAKSNESAPVGPGGSLTFTLEVPEGYKLGFSTMFVFSNDWFFSLPNEGYPLFNGDGSPISGMEATQDTYLFDAGTEEDQPVGFGPDQAPFQSGPDTGAPDANSSIRRVMEIEDLQFGKGTISSMPGVSGFEDPRGGYNLVRVTVTAN